MEAKGEWENLKKTSMRLKRVSDWIEYHGQGGKTFYYNETSREFQWERPVDLAPPEPKEEPEPVQTENGGEMWQSDTPVAVAPEWFPYKDPNTGMRFWYNHTTGASQWETPEGVNEADHDEANDQDWDLQEGEEQGVYDVNHVDDLGI